MEHPIVDPNNERRMRFAAEGSLRMNWKIFSLRKDEVITHASRPERLANLYIHRAHAPQGPSTHWASPKRAGLQ